MKESIKNRIAVLLPYDELLRYAAEIAQEMKIDIIIRKVGTANAVEVAQKLKKHGIEIVIARGNLAKEIQDNVDVEVVRVVLTGFEFFELLWRYKDFKGPIGIIESKEFIYGCRKINKSLGLDLHYFQVDCVNDFSFRTQCAIDSGMKLLIGGSWGIEIQDQLQKLNIQYEMLHSQKPSVKQAIENAISLFYAKRREKNRHQILKTVLDFSQSGIVVVNQSNEVINMNPVAEQILKTEASRCIGRQCDSLFPQLRLHESLETMNAEMGTTDHFFGTGVVVDRVPMLVNSEVKGAIAFIHRAAEIVNMENSIRQDLVDRRLTTKYTFRHIIGISEVMQATIEMAKEYSRIDSTVLITGETGTGKELFAQSIHGASERCHRPFVAINCSALPPTLLESELFGYKDGAFTGAKKGGKMGLFELAHKGTLFLDEIGEIDKGVQAKLLRVLQEQEVMRIGDVRVIPVDVRVIAATNRNLLGEVNKGNFREDLYYRLNVLNLNLPPLRERKGDLPILAEGIREKINKKLNCQVTGFSPGVIRILEGYCWPGNIRELENLIEKMIVIKKIGMIDEKVLPFIQNCFQPNRFRSQQPKNMTLAAAEEAAIKQALERNQGNKTHTAQELGIDRTTLIRKMKMYSFDR